MISLLGGVSPALALAYFCFRMFGSAEPLALRFNFFLRQEKSGMHPSIFIRLVFFSLLKGYERTPLLFNDENMV